MKIEKILRLIWDEFVYGGHFQSLGAASVVLVSALLLKIKITFDCLIIAYLLFYPLYLYNRYKEINIDYLTNPERTKHIKRYLKVIPVILYLIILILIIGLVYFSGFLGLVFGLTLLILGIFYTIFFKKATQKIYFLKNIYVAAFFALMPFFLVSYYSYPISKHLFFSLSGLFLFIFLKTFLMQAFLDLKDVETDTKEKLLTLPVKFGREQTFKILIIFNFFVSFFLPAIFFFYFNILPGSVLFFSLTFIFDLYCYYLAEKGKYFGYILQGGKFILWVPLIILGEKIL